MADRGPGEVAGADEGLRLQLPEGRLRLDAGGAFRHLFTGSWWEPEAAGDGWGLPLPELQAAFPVALVERDARSN
ncbi:MAG: hypothetical protein FJ086_08775 [Deltaproteobacteria bacterium]|nr:hypothetical protein [Deltaproteobacteria bacterium]